MDAAPVAVLKSCCANLYSSEAVRLLVGESFHPGGIELTRRLADLLDLRPGDEVLDIASGPGTSAIELASSLGCSVTGVE
ncbi:MAG: SAM-dependent methyltransferase, partial [Candidatus Dormibacteria bacterium]